MAAPAMPVHVHVVAVAVHVAMIAVHVTVMIAVHAIVMIALVMAVLRISRGRGKQAKGESRRERGGDFHVSSPIRMILTGA